MCICHDLAVNRPIFSEQSECLNIQTIVFNQFSPSNYTLSRCGPRLLSFFLNDEQEAALRQTIRARCFIKYKYIARCRISSYVIKYERRNVCRLVKFQLRGARSIFLLLCVRFVPQTIKRPAPFGLSSTLE